jgi:hypothetical protein
MKIGPFATLLPLPMRVIPLREIVHPGGTRTSAAMGASGNSSLTVNGCWGWSAANRVGFAVAFFMRVALCVFFGFAAVE